MKTKTNIFLIIAFLLFVLAIWSAFLFIPQPNVIAMPAQEEIIDLTNSDFDDTIYIYDNNSTWETYAEKLLTPEDFDRGNIQGKAAGLTAKDYRDIQYATHKMEMKLPPGEIYGMTLDTADYSMKIYINGKLTDTVGNPADNSKDTVPRTAKKTYFFESDSDVTTVIVQAANWVHKQGAYPPEFYVGTSDNIVKYNNHDLIMSFLITGGLLTAFLYYLGLFILNRSRKPVLIFSVCCLLLALMANSFIPLFIPEYNWFIAIGFEYIVHFLTFGMLVLFLDTFFIDLYHRYIARAYYVITAVFILLTIVLAPRIYTGLLIIFDGLSVFMIIYTLVSLALKLKEKKLQNFLAFIGISFVCLLGLNDILFHNDIQVIGQIFGQKFTTPIAMLFFVFCFGLIISIDYEQTERKMIRAEQMVREAEQRYTELLVIQGNATHVNSSDFNLSQRETDVLWLMLSGKTRKEIADILSVSINSVNTYFSRIYKKTGVSNMGGLFQIFGIPKK